MSASPSHHVATAGSAITGDPATGAKRPAGQPALLRRPALIAGAIAILGLAWYALVARPPELSAVQNGRRFSAAERRQAERTLRSAGVDGIQFRNGQLLVPPGALPASDAVLAKSANSGEADADPSPATNSLLDQFATGKRQERADAAARAAKLGRLLAQLPGVESAEIVWDEEPRIGRRQAPRVMATVFLKPDSGSTIGLDTVQAVRSAVAGSRAHLATTDVAVMDLEQKVTYRGELDAGTRVEHRQTDVAAEYRARITEALADINGVRIAVSLRPVAADAPLNVRREPFAGLSGPNLRLEVIAAAHPVQVVSEMAPIGQNTVACARQLDVSVEVPTDHIIKAATAIAGSRTAAISSNEATAFREYVRRAVETDVRTRVAAVISDLPSDLATSQLTVRLTMPTAAQWPVPAESAGAGEIRWDWSGLRSLVETLQNQEQATGWGLVMFAAILAAAIIRFRRRSTERRSARQSELSRPPAAFLPGINAGDWAPLVAREPIDVIAGLLSKLPPDEVSHILSHLEPVQQREVLELAATSALDERQLGLLRRRIRSELKASPSRTFRSDTTMTKRATSAVGSPVAAPFSFDELAKLDDGSLQQLAGRVHADTWTAALVGASPKLHRRLTAINRISGALSNRPDRRPLRLREIEAAQRLIVDEWRALQPLR
ncbi:MAG: hypothetical protein JNG89_00430 [Planctomycetaceae bacterium]|nr:hypothetical protein [Planctomycetaceae bacterium]